MYFGRIYRNGALDYCSSVKPTRLEAAEACFAARPNADRCMTSEARYNENLKEVVPTHYGIQWIMADRRLKGAAGISAAANVASVMGCSIGRRWRLG